MDTLKNLAALTEHDFAGEWLAALFGSVPLKHAFGAYSAGLLALATGFLAYNVLAGTVQAANEGKPFSKLWHPVWAPIKIVLGMSLLVPVSGGLSSAQLLVYEGAKFSAQMANATWSAFADSVLRDGYAVSTPGGDGRALVRDFVLLEICGQASATLDRAAGRAPTPLPPTNGTRLSTVGGTSTTVWRYDTACGDLRIPDAIDQPGFSSARRDAAAAMLQELRDFATETLPAVLPGGDGAVLDQAPEKAAELARWLRTLGDQYDSKIGDAAARATSTQQQTERERVASYMTQHGWTTAGMAWRTLAQASALAADLAGAQHATNLANTGAGRPDVKRAVDVVAAYLNLGSREIEVGAHDLAAVGDEKSDYLTRGLAPLRSALEWANTGDGRDVDPVAHLTAWGHKLMLAGQITLAGGLTLATVANTTPADMAGLDGAWHFAEPIIMGAAVLAMIGGAILSYVLVLLPWVFVLFLALSWLVACAEALIAIPIWALLLTDPRGESFIARMQTPGLLLLFTLLLRPVLGVLALCASYIIVPALLRFMDSTFALAMTGGTGGHIVGIFGALVTVFAAVYLAYQVCVRSLGLITSMPERIGRWFGSPDGARDEAHGGLALIAGLGTGMQRATPSPGRMTPKKGNPDPTGSGLGGGRAPRQSGGVGGAKAPAE